MEKNDSTYVAENKDFQNRRLSLTDACAKEDIGVQLVATKLDHLMWFAV